MITLTPKQKEARKLAQSKARFILFRGGSRSGKSFAVCKFILDRALITPNSRHGIFRLIGADARATIFDLTLRAVFDAEHPGLWDQLKAQKKINDTEMTIELPNGSLIVVKGLDDSTRQERILGDEYATIFVNEVSQFRSFDIFQKLIGRLSQEYPIEIDGKMTDRVLKPKLFLDCNPPKTKRHWTFDAFMRGVNPISQEPWPRPDEWAQVLMNPVDNQQNISSSYLADLENLSAADRKRFMEGEWGSENENGMFRSEWWQGDGPHRRHPAMTPEEAQARGFRRTIVVIDPAKSASKGSDETGIIVAACDDHDHAFILKDASGKMTPNGWARRAIELAREWDADYILIERDGSEDYGREAILNVSTEFAVHEAKSGGMSKPSRAGPVANQYEAGRVHHCGQFPDLEAQLEEFHLDWSRTKDGSPDRLDALVYAVKDLIVKEKEKRGGSQSRFSLYT